MTMFGPSAPRSAPWRPALILLASLWLAAFAPSPAAPAGADPVPVLAYYYIWFDPGSWERAKTDLPLLGPYSSSDTETMRQHVRWAQAVGIDGFIVSWKATSQLDARLESLVQVADEEGFRLAIIYQGLDFERRPLPVERIRDDLEAFLRRYRGHPVFDIFGKPLVIWSGTWEFSPEEVESVATERGDRYLLLASERQVDSYEALGHLVDGNAYYWSSADPLATPGYEEKLTAMAAAVHARSGLWIAPAAAGFDAREIGGFRVVDRRGGDTFHAALAAALRSSPDAIGVISWNEFSENTHIEPSRNYGQEALRVLAEVQDGVVPPLPEFDSNAPEATTPIEPLRLLPFALLILVGGGSLAVLTLRRLRHHAPRTSRPQDEGP